MEATGMTTASRSLLDTMLGEGLYASLLVFTLVVPLLLSFDKKLKFFTRYKYLFPSLVVVASFFIFFDILLTKEGVWGFNSRYHINGSFLGLPLEEWLFFIVIPYSSIFLHEVFVFYFPNLRLGRIISRKLVLFFIVLLTLVLPFVIGRTYTAYVTSLLIVTFLVSLLDKTGIVQHFFVSFLVILIPFMIVNGILTGTLIDEEVVWYNDFETLGIRLNTIPVEDVGYAFSMILLNLLLIRRLEIYSGRENHLAS